MINAAYEHFTTQASKKPKTALINFMGPVVEGPTYGAEKNKYPMLKAI